MERKLSFRLLTPGGLAETVDCTSVTLVCRDGKEAPGGSLGIKYGHLPAVIALADDCPVHVKDGEEAVFSSVVRGGFAAVRDNIVTVVTDGAETREPVR